MIERGRRVSAARAFPKPARSRPNLDVRTNARARAVLFEGKRATGVSYLRAPGGPATVVHARREVVLCAGTVNTARLLQVSGVGLGGLLGGLGVPVIHELRGVGENFRDHYAVRCVVRARPGIVTLNELARGPRLAGQVLRWASRRPSIPRPSLPRMWTGKPFPGRTCRAMTNCWTTPAPTARPATT